MKKMIVAAALCAFSTGAFCDNIENRAAAEKRALREARVAAVNEIANKMQFRFVGEDLLNDLMQKVSGDLSEADHKRLLELQAEADKLNWIRSELLKIDGITEKDELVVLVDQKLAHLEKEIYAFLDNTGIWHWRSGVALLAGAAVGGILGKNTKEYKESRTGKIYHGIGSYMPEKMQNWVSEEHSHKGRGLFWGLTTFVLVEWMLRGRFAVGIKCVTTTGQFLAKATEKFFIAACGEGGWIDKGEQWAEEAFHGLGKKIDELVEMKLSAPAVLGIVAVIGGTALYYTHKS
jgi:hypothetical protein